MLTYKNDPLLLKEKSYKEYKTSNDLLNTTFSLILENETLNLYTALVKSVDFKKTLKSMPFCKIEMEILDKYMTGNLKINNYRNLRKKIFEYRSKEKINTSFITCFKKWKSDNIFPIILLRVISLEHEKDLEILTKLLNSVEYFTDSRNFSVFNPPRKLNELLTKQQAYFSGAAMGDGGFSNNQYWVIVDGGTDDDLPYSKEYLIKIRNSIKTSYNINFSNKNPRKREQRLELWVSNRWFGRFINFWFGLPFGKKTNRIEKPKIFNLSKKALQLYAYFWRGMFDTDGHCSSLGKNISLVSATKKLIDECEKDLHKLNIKTSKIKRKIKFDSYLITIRSESYRCFAEKIGFSHPRKLKNMLEMLTVQGSFLKSLGLKKENIVFGKFFDLRLLKNLRIYGVTEIVKKIRTKNGLYQQTLAKKLKVNENHISMWENKKGIPFSKFCEIWLFDEKSIKQLFEFLSGNNDILWSTSGRGALCKRAKLPIGVNEKIDNIAYSVRPYSNELRIKHNKKMFNDIEKQFQVKVRNIRESVYSVHNKTVQNFFQIFYDYEYYWKALTNKEIKELKNSLTAIWN
ncbi:MAG: LAGLIDADG family homing endonuclease [Candidatus Diapherotrites archaeon]